MTMVFLSLKICTFKYLRVPATLARFRLRVGKCGQRLLQVSICPPPGFIDESAKSSVETHGDHQLFPLIRFAMVKALG